MRSKKQEMDQERKGEGWREIWDDSLEQAEMEMHPDLSQAQRSV